MNKRYMDFKPAGAAKPVNKVAKAKVSAGTKSVSTNKTAWVKPASATGERKKAPNLTEVNELEINEMFEARTTRPRAGVSEGGRVATKKINYQQKFVKTAVEKRPLSNERGNGVKVVAAEPTTMVKTGKRPLSKNVYEKKAEPAKEKASGPVTIIDKPEKESKASLVVTIVITIILGAAAGVVAFLLLPK